MFSKNRDNLREYIIPLKCCHTPYSNLGCKGLKEVESTSGAIIYHLRVFQILLIHFYFVLTATIRNTITDLTLPQMVFFGKCCTTAITHMGFPSLMNYCNMHIQCIFSSKTIIAFDTFEWFYLFMNR